MKMKFKLLTLSASLLACGIGVSGQAQANAYAVATNNIKDGYVATFVDGILDTSGKYMSFGTPASESSTSATLNGNGVAHNSVTPPPDSPVSTVGSPVRTNENVNANGYYNLFGKLGTNYSWGDAKVVSEQALTGTPIVARNAAESNLAGRGSANGDGTNKSSTVLSIPVVIGGDCGAGHTCQVNFSFLADPYILAVLDAGVNPPHVARGTIAMSITLTKVNDLIPTFAWAPNGDCPGGVGTCAGVAGGTEYADAENLNLTREALVPGQTSEYSAPYANNVYGAYGARTIALGTGTYTLTLFMNEKTDVQLPEPATIGLLGLGLLGLGFARRRKQA